MIVVKFLHISNILLAYVDFRSFFSPNNKDEKSFDCY